METTPQGQGPRIQAQGGKGTNKLYPKRENSWVPKLGGTSGDMLVVSTGWLQSVCGYKAPLATVKWFPLHVGHVHRVEATGRVRWDVIAMWFSEISSFDVTECCCTSVSLLALCSVKEEGAECRPPTDLRLGLS